MLIRSLYVAGALGALSHLAGRAAAQTHEPAPPPDSAGTIIGWVSERATCEPVAGAVVSVDGARGARPLDATADSAGRFTLTRIPAGEHALRVRAASLAPAELPAVEVQPGELTDVLVELDRAGTPPIGSSAGRRAAGDSAAPRITWFPERPKQGTLFRITIADSSSRAWTGSVAGEALHFSRDSSGSYSAIAPVPIDAVDSLVVRVGAERRDSGDAGRTVAIPVTPGSYRVEKLRVAPAFGKKPDAALAERLARESKRARDVACRARRTPRLWGATFVRPRPGRVTSGFGHGREFNGVVQSRHMGTDLAGAVGAPIRATNRGVVALVGHFYLGGRIVYLDHGGGLVSAYLHMSKVEVSEGDTVEAGGIVGRVGATGRVTGPHLHWIVRYGAVTVDPMSLFTIAGAPTAREATKGGGGR